MRGLAVGEIDTWVAAAQAGARAVYGRGHSHADCAPGVQARTALLAGHALIRIHHVRTGDARTPFDFVMVRLAKPLPTRFPDLKPVAAAPAKPVTPVPEPAKPTIAGSLDLGPGMRVQRWG